MTSKMHKHIEQDLVKNCALQRTFHLVLTGSSPLNKFFINVSYHILVVSLTLMALF